MASKHLGYRNGSRDINRHVLEEDRIKEMVFDGNQNKETILINELTIFENAEFGRIREITIDNEPWFVGKDVAGILGYARATKAIQDHVDFEDKDEIPIQDSIGRMQNTPIINESGLYALIFGSKLESAKRAYGSRVLPPSIKHSIKIKNRR